MCFFCSLFFSTIVVKTVPKFNKPFSFTVYGKNGTLLGASASEDMQWRFPMRDPLPESYKKAVILYEDKNFYMHCGIDFPAILRAAYFNVLRKKTISGASTISMQVIRLSEGNAQRTFSRKLYEAAAAFLLELKYSKDEILKLYAEHAPFGGNVVGIEAASRRYFSRSPSNISQAEAACLAVLPNQPALVHPGKSPELLKIKRDFLLRKMYKVKAIDFETMQLSIAEPVPQKPQYLPRLAPHYLEFLKNKMENSTYTPQNITTIDEDIQRITINTADFHFKKLAESKVHNIAILVLDTESGSVLAYAGNTGLDDPNGKNAHVDMIQAKRSSGSLLKPFLFAGMLDAGLLLPDQLMIDVPTKIAGYTPENNSERYSGAVPAGEALSKSLNVPFVRALREFTIPAFLALLKKCGFTTFTRSADEYGLPLILGGGEITLYEAVNAYRLMMLKSQGKLKTVYPFSEGACSLTLEALIKGTRPEEEALWQSFSSAQKIAWKTGTSFGWRDAWSIGVTAKYSIGVWVGNASGEGRPEIRSGTAAAPILFTIFKLLQKSKWEPTSEIYFEPITVCAHSGYLAAQYCAQTKQAVKPLDAPSSRQCPYCRPVSLTKDGLFRILPQDIQGLPRIENRFSLPAGVEYFYAKLHPEYCPLPAWKKGSSGSYNSDFQLLFPEQGTQVLIPIELDGTLGAMTAKAVHKDPTAIIFWDIDGDYLGKTEKFHQWNIRVDSGSHILTLTDQNGNQIKRTFTVLKRRGN